MRRSQLRQTRVLLIGGRGQLGSDIRQHIAQERTDWAIAVPTRDQFDLTRPVDAQFRRLVPDGTDIVINCAAFHNLTAVELQTGLAFAVNAYAVRELARVCDRVGAHLVHVSTDYVFGAEACDRRRREEDVPGPINVYGASKLMGESLLAATGGSWTVCRVASLFGVAGSAGKGGNFVETMLAKARQRAAITVVDNRFMSPTATYDAARAIVGAASLRLRGVYHVVNEGDVSWWTFASAILAAANFHDYPVVRRQDRVQDETAPLRPLRTSLDNSKLADALGYRLDDWQEALGRYLHARPAAPRAAGGGAE